MYCHLDYANLGQYCSYFFCFVTLQEFAVLQVPIRPSSIALMHVYVTRANFTTKPRL